MDPRLRAVARFGVMTVNKPMARRRFARALPEFPRPARLEIGGLHPREGWIVTNVNAVTRYFMDATAPWPFGDAELTHVYADNVIEHVSLDQGRTLLREAYRCLAPGGAIRLVTPDIEAHVRLYLSGEDAMASTAAREYRAAGLTVEHPVDVARIPIGEFGHHSGYVYDFAALSSELGAAGFGNPVQLPVGESRTEAFANLENRTSHGIAQMAVEAQR